MCADIQNAHTRLNSDIVTDTNHPYIRVDIVVGVVFQELYTNIKSERT